MSASATEDGKMAGHHGGAEAQTRAGDLPRLRSADLLSGGREAIIEHGKEQYRLRLTSNDKLILTK